MPTVLNFDDFMEDAFIQGISLSKVVTWTDDEGLPIDTTGYSATMKIKRNYGAETLFELSTANSRITMGGVNGTVNLTVTKEIMATAPHGFFVYDLIMTDVYGTNYRFLEGVVYIKRKVS